MVSDTELGKCTHKHIQKPLAISHSNMDNKLMQTKMPSMRIKIEKNNVLVGCKTALKRFDFCLGFVCIMFIIICY